MVLVRVPATEPGTGFGTGTGLHWWFRYRFWCEIQFRSGPSINIDCKHSVFFLHLHIVSSKENAGAGNLSVIMGTQSVVTAPTVLCEIWESWV